MDPGAHRGRPTSIGQAPAQHLLGRNSSTSPHPQALGSNLNGASALALANQLNQQIARQQLQQQQQQQAAGFDPTFAADLQYSLGNGAAGGYSDFGASGLSAQQQNGAFTNPNFAGTGAGDPAAFSSFGLNPGSFDDPSAGLDANLLNDFDPSTLDSILSSQSSPDHLSPTRGNGSMSHSLTPSATTSPPHTNSPPHLLAPDDARRQSGTPSPHASPNNFSTATFPMQQHQQNQPNRPRNVSESLDPSSAFYPPQGQNEWAHMNLGGYRHQRTPSDNISDVSSNHASPYLGTLDSFDAVGYTNQVQQSSPLLNSSGQLDPVFGDTSLGLQGFSLSENNNNMSQQQQQQQQQNYHTPGHSPGHSPLLLPQQQQALPAFTADNNFGLVSAHVPNGLNGGNASGLDLFPNAGAGPEPFPSYNQQQISAASPGGMSDTMSPPAIEIDFVPTVQQNANPAPGMRATGSEDALAIPRRE